MNISDKIDNYEREHNRLQEMFGNPDNETKKLYLSACIYVYKILIRELKGVRRSLNDMIKVKEIKK